MSLRSTLEKKSKDSVLQEVDNSVTVEDASDDESSEEEKDKTKKSEHKGGGCCGDDGRVRAKPKEGYNWAALSVLIMFVAIPLLTGFQYVLMLYLSISLCLPWLSYRGLLSNGALESQ